MEYEKESLDHKYREIDGVNSKLDRKFEVVVDSPLCSEKITGSDPSLKPSVKKKLKGIKSEAKIKTAE